MRGHLKVSTLWRCLQIDSQWMSKYPSLALVTCQVWSWRSSELLSSVILSLNAVTAEEGPVGQMTEAGEVQMISCLASSQATALHGHFHWPHGAFYFLILAAWPQLYTHKWLWTWLENPLHSVSSVFYLLSLPYHPCKVLSFFLSVAALSLKRKCPLRCLRILCELKIDQRQRIESWELQTIFLTLFTSSGSQLLTFLHRLCPASPCTHTHRPQSPQQHFSRAIDATAGSFSQLGGYRDIDGT